MRLHAAFIVSFLLAGHAQAQELNAGPYLQDATPTSVWILWETTEGEESRVEWGTSAALGQTAIGTAQPSEGAHRLHEVQLTGLTPGTRYHYRAITGAAISETFTLTTPPRRDADVTFRLVAVSDMQRDSANPDIYRQVIHDGVIDFLTAEVGPDMDQALSFVLVPGDLVEDGAVYASWVGEFLEPGAALMAQVPFYPVLGNHEANSPNYYRYFHLPDNGSTEMPERFWSMDYANVRVIGLDSNLLILGGEQEDFLERALTEACTDETIDFVFAELHHAHRSELWPVGEARLATQVANRMTRFSDECAKPSIHFYGHTHGYSRGASRDGSHLWVNVASAGGNIDYWDEYTQYDVEEVEVSQDEWGFVLVEVTGGENPAFHLRRVSRGNEMLARDNEIRDELTVRLRNEGPGTPLPQMPIGRVARECNTLLASAFTDADGDEHGATQWQVSTRCDDFEDPLIDRYRTRENWYGGVDLAAGDDLTDEPLEDLAEGTYYCWRARYRDRGLAWSEWTAPAAFLIDEDGAGVGQGCTDPTPLTPPQPDAGPSTPAPTEGCGCRSASGGDHPALLAFAIAACLAAARRRRRRAGARGAAAPPSVRGPRRCARRRRPSPHRPTSRTPGCRPGSRPTGASSA